MLAPLPTTPKKEETAPSKEPVPVQTPTKEVFETDSPWYSSNVISSKLHPLSRIITEIAGSSWTVTYYAQLKDKDESLNGHDSGQLAVYQQYQKIERLILRVETAIPLAPDVNEETNDLSVRGEATMYANGYIKPNKGDMFIADLGNGIGGLFEVTETPRALTFNKDTAYGIAYTLKNLLDKDRKVVEDLEKKVVRTYVFHENYLRNGVNPFLTVSETERVNQLSFRLVEVTENYLREFYNRQCGTIAFPFSLDGWRFSYDDSLTRFLKSSVRTNYGDIAVHSINSNNRSLNIDRQDIFKMVESRTNRRNPFMVAKANYRDARYFMASPVMGGIRMTPFDYYCYPSEDLSGTPISEAESNTQMGTSRYPTVYGQWYGGVVYDAGVSYGALDKNVGPKPEPLVLDPEPPIIYSNMYDDYYILSEHWYKEETEKYSLFESMLNDYLSNERVDLTKFFNVLDDIDNWPKIDRYSYLPILIYLGYTIVERGA